MRHLILIVVILSVLVAPAAGDVIHTRDGRALVGTLHRVGSFAWDVIGADRRATYVADADVASIEVNARPPTDPVGAARRLADLRRGVARLDDPAEAVARYRKFIATGADAAALAAAGPELAVWQDRVDRHLARLGGQWVPATTREAAMAASLADVVRARQQLKQGQAASAEPLLLAALKVDPDDASAEYMLGLIQAGRGQPSAAGRAFAAADGLVPGHAATLNDWAAVLWQQRRFLPALALYERAMAAAADDPAVLDVVQNNVASALADLPPALAPNPAVVRVRQRSDVLAVQNAAAMAARGLHRFGGAWLTDEQMARVAVQQKQDRQQLDALSAAFDRQQDVIRQTDLQIAQAEQQMRSTSGDVGEFLTSYDGYAGRRQPTAGYYELSNDVEQLQRRRAAQVADLDALQRQARSLDRRIAGQPDGPAPQRLIGPEGTPLRLPLIAGLR